MDPFLLFLFLGGAKTKFVIIGERVPGRELDTQAGPGHPRAEIAAAAA